MLDFLTFALCAPYSETTDGKQFDVLLEKVADRGRTLYRLFQQPSHTIVKVNSVKLTSFSCSLFVLLSCLIVLWVTQYFQSHCSECADTDQIL